MDSNKEVDILDILKKGFEEDNKDEDTKEIEVTNEVIKRTQKTIILAESGKTLLNG